MIGPGPAKGQNQTPPSPRTADSNGAPANVNHFSPSARLAVRKPVNDCTEGAVRVLVADPPACSMASSPPSGLPFLRFPAEVRLCIYQYLIPNVPIRNFPLIRGRNKTVHLRTDNLPCCPAILRTNHQIHNELIPEWYGSTSYEVVLDNKYVLFCGKVIPPYAPLPSTIQWVQSLHLKFSIQGAPRHIQSTSTLEHLLGFQDRVVALARSLSHHEMRQLRKLHVDIAVDIPLLLSLSKTPSELLDLLNWNFSPFREIVTDVPEVEWELNEQSYGIQSLEFLQSYAELRAIMHGYLDDMRSDMLCHPDGE